MGAQFNEIGHKTEMFEKFEKKGFSRFQVVNLYQ